MRDHSVPRDRAVARSPGCGADGADIGQAQHVLQPVAIAQRLAEQLAGVEEQDRRGGIDLRHQVQQHRRFRRRKTKPPRSCRRIRPFNASSRMPCASRPWRPSCNIAQPRPDRWIGGAAARPVEDARRMPRLVSMTVTLRHSQPFSAIRSRTFVRNFGGRKPVRAPTGRAPRARSFSRAVHSGPKLLRQPFAQRPRQARRRPPVEAVSSRSPRRTMAGTWKSQSGRTSSTLTSTPRRPGPGRPGARLRSPADRPRTGVAGPRQRVGGIGGKQARFHPGLGQQGRAAGQGLARAGQADLDGMGIEDKGEHSGSLCQVPQRSMRRPDKMQE